MANSEEIDPLEEPKLPEDASPDKIAIFEAIRAFYHSNEQELALTQFTKPKLRVFIHEIADAYGLYHRSEGKGRDRAVALRKTAPQIPCGRFDQTTKNWTPCASRCLHFSLSCVTGRVHWRQQGPTFGALNFFSL
jgi:hypothetical protein